MIFEVVRAYLDFDWENSLEILFTWFSVLPITPDRPLKFKTFEPIPTYSYTRKLSCLKKPKNVFWF